MNSVRLTPQAKADLNDIWEYSVKQWNIDQAEAYMRALDATFPPSFSIPDLGSILTIFAKAISSFQQRRTF